MKKYSNYVYQLFCKKNDDIATASINWDNAALLVRKKMFLPCFRRKIKIKPVITNGMVSGLKIRAPYWFIKQVLLIFRYKPYIDEEFTIQNCFGYDFGYGYREEWVAPHFSDIQIKNKEIINTDKNI